MAGSEAERAAKATPGAAGAASLPVAVIADALDRLGHRAQVMISGMRPVVPGDPVLGPPFTIQAVAHPVLSERPYEKELEAVDAIPAGGVVVFSAGGMMETGIWGELLSTRALARGGSERSSTAASATSSGCAGSPSRCSRPPSTPPTPTAAPR